MHGRIHTDSPPAAVLLAQGKAAAADLAGAADDHKAFRVDALDEPFDFRQLAVGDVGEDDADVGLKIAALPLDDGHAAVALAQDSPADGVGGAADDQKPGLAGAEAEQLVQHQRVNEDQQDAVKDLFRRVIHGLKKQDEAVKNIEAGRNGHAPQLVER